MSFLSSQNLIKLISLTKELDATAHSTSQYNEETRGWWYVADMRQHASWATRTLAP